VGASYNLSTASSLAEPTCEPVPRRHSPRVSPMTKPPQSSSHTLIAPNLRRARDARSRALRGWSSPHDFSRLLVQNFPPSSSLSTGGGVCVCMRVYSQARMVSFKDTLEYLPKNHIFVELRLKKVANIAHYGWNNFCQVPRVIQTPRSHFATTVSHFIDIFICISQSINFPHLSPYNLAHTLYQRA